MILKSSGNRLVLYPLITSACLKSNKTIPILQNSQHLQYSSDFYLSKVASPTPVHHILEFLLREMPLKPVPESYKGSTPTPSDPHLVVGQKQCHLVWSTSLCSSDLALGDDMSFPKIKSTLKRPHCHTTESQKNGLWRQFPKRTVKMMEAPDPQWNKCEPLGISVSPKGDHTYFCA